MSQKHAKGADAKYVASPSAECGRQGGATRFAKSTSFPTPPATATCGLDGGGPDFEFDLNKVSRVLWDERFEKDLFGGVDLSQLANHGDVCRTIFSGCITEFGQQIHFEELIPYMVKRNMLTDSELYHLREKPIPKIQKANYLALEVLPSKGRLLTPISLFYSCLVESAATEDGLECHYYLAKRLRESVHENIHRRYGILQEIQEREERETGVIPITGKVCQNFPSGVSETTILALIDQLKLSNCSPPVTADRTIPWIFECWRRLYPECDWTEVVEVLVLVPKLGYLVSNLLSPCRSSPPQMCRFVHSFKDNWPSLAEHLGYPWQLVQTIQNRLDGRHHAQIKAFLKYWVFPDCGMKNNRRIVDRLKMHLDNGTESLQTTEVPREELKQLMTATRQIVPKQVDPETMQSCEVPFSSESGMKSDIPQGDDSELEVDDLETAKSKYPHPSPLQSKAPPPHVEGKSPHSSGATDQEPHVTQTMRDRGHDLLQAIGEGNMQVIIELLLQPFDTECSGQDGRTPFLHFCASRGMQEQLEQAINAGSAINAIDADGNCCFHYEEVLQHHPVVTMLLKVCDKRQLKYPVNIVNKQGMSPLMVACRMGVSCLDSIQLLLAHGAEPNGPKSARVPPLIMASKDNSLKIVELLSMYGANINGHDKVHNTTALIQACVWRHTELVLFLLEHGAAVNSSEKDGTTALSVAVKMNAVNIIKLLIKCYATVDQCSFTGSYGGSEETPLAIACAENFQEAAGMLIEAGAKMNYRCSGQVPPIGFAIIRRHLGMVRFMLDHTKPESRGVSNLSNGFDIAMAFDKFEAATMLLEDAGGLEHAMQMVKEDRLLKLLREYKGLVRTGIIKFDREVLQSQISIEDENHVMEEILQQFCFIYMKAANDNHDLETLSSFVVGDAASFLRNYNIYPMSPRELKSGLIRGNGESALTFLIEQKAVDATSFIIATEMYHTKDIHGYCQKLAGAAQMLQGGGLGKPDIVLEDMLSGKLLLVEGPEGPEDARCASGGASGYGPPKHLSETGTSRHNRGGGRSHSTEYHTHSLKTVDVDQQGVKRGQSLPGQTSAGADNIFRKFEIQIHTESSSSVSEKSTPAVPPGPSPTQLPGTAASVQPPQPPTVTREPAPTTQPTPTPIEPVKSHRDSDNSKKSTSSSNGHQHQLPGETPSRIKALTKQQEMHESAPTSSLSSAFPPDTFLQETHPPSTAYSGQLATGMDPPTIPHATPIQEQKTATHEVQHPFKPTSGADREPLQFTEGSSSEEMSPSKSVSPFRHPSTSASSSSGVLSPTSSTASTALNPINDVYKDPTAIGKESSPYSSTSPNDASASDTVGGEAQASFPSDTRKEASITAAESPADHQPATSPDRHQIQRQEGHESKDRDPGSAEETPQTSISSQTSISPLSLQLGQGQFSREVSRDYACSDGKKTCKKVFRLKIINTNLLLAKSQIMHLHEKGYRRAEVTVHLGKESAGMYWFLLPGQTTMQAIERALDEACQNGVEDASLEFEFWKLSDVELSTSIKTPDIAHSEQLNPVSPTSNLRLVELRLLNAYHTGSRHVSYCYGNGDFLEEELSKDSLSDFLITFVKTCCSSEASDRYSTELRFMFSHAK